MGNGSAQRGPKTCFLVKKGPKPTGFLDFAPALSPGMQRYWLYNFKTVAHNIPEYAQEVWKDSNEN